MNVAFEKVRAVEAPARQLVSGSDARMDAPGCARLCARASATIVNPRTARSPYEKNTAPPFRRPIPI